MSPLPWTGVIYLWQAQRNTKLGFLMQRLPAHLVQMCLECGSAPAVISTGPPAIDWLDFRAPFWAAVCCERVGGWPTSCVQIARRWLEVAVFPASLCSPQTNDTLSTCIFTVLVFLSLCFRLSLPTWSAVLLIAGLWRIWLKTKFLSLLAR